MKLDKMNNTQSWLAARCHFLAFADQFLESLYIYPPFLGAGPAFRVETVTQGAGHPSRFSKAGHH
jgi:hypothetical protein